MSHRPLIVLADDLTGAAEVAAIAHDAGLCAVVLTKIPRRAIVADVLIFDTNTRLASPATAARRVFSTVTRLAKIPHAGFFKKSDSVLRGPVLAELTACAQALKLKRTLFVPCNPSLGRVILGGHYFVKGTPLHETEFARDPHHPSTTSRVVDLLGTKLGSLVSCHAPGERLPGTGTIVGEASSAEDITAWALVANRHTLPAGGADFFRAWLSTQPRPRSSSAQATLPSGAALLLHGTTATALDSSALFFRGTVAPLPSKVAATLRRLGAIAVAAGPIVSRDRKTSLAISRSFAQLTKKLHDEEAFEHLLIVGGSTAATVLHALNWTQLKVLHVWGPGVVTLEPFNAPGFAVTLKPGSYAWPTSIRLALPRILLS